MSEYSNDLDQESIKNGEQNIVNQGQAKFGTDIDRNDPLADSKEFNSLIHGS